MSERRNLEHVTKTGRGTIHTRPATDEYRDGWERTFGGKGRARADELLALIKDHGLDLSVGTVELALMEARGLLRDKQEPRQDGTA
ncbi:MAG TPA: hypothetical protein VFP50_18250 [Anaeromyxobacteraceae bacterium]|nr:hypothetical protein [Anaeromyxobacteraceae bacterium]